MRLSHKITARLAFVTPTGSGVSCSSLAGSRAARVACNFGAKPNHICGALALLIAINTFLSATPSETETSEESDSKTIQSAFASTVVKLTAKPGDASIATEWTYTNHWDFPLAVEKFDTSCGCLSGQSDQPVLEPGKTGKLRATFSPGLHRGLLRKSLHVRFVGHEKPVELTVEASIPSHVELSSSELVWRPEDRSKPKSIEITSGTGKPFNIVGTVGLTDSQFTLTTETLAPGTRYRIHITPTASAKGQHCLQVRTDSPDPRDQVRAVFVRVER